MSRARAAHLAVVVAALLTVAAAAAEEAPPSLPAPPDVAAPPADAERAASGLASKVIVAGQGTERPTAADVVIVRYSGWTTDGAMFDSSVARGQAVRLPLDMVIPGWREGLQLMVEGETRRLWIPEELAYAGRSDRPQGMLVFDVELVEIVHAPAAPVDVAAPAADAAEIRNGLWSKVLAPGDGEERPTTSSTVVVHYTGWTTDGAMFDTTVLRGEPASFRLDQVIRGWTFGLQEMTKGERRRFWIDEKLAYQGKEGAPAGMLVFDVELVNFW